MSEVGFDARLLPPKTKNEKEALEQRIRTAGRVAGRLARTAVKATGVTLAAGLMVGANEYVADVQAVRAELATTHPYVIETSPPLDLPPVPLPAPEGVLKTLSPDDISLLRDTVEPPKFVTINMPGFGMVETYKPHAALSPFDALGAQWSIHYDNQGIDVGVLADTIVTKIKEDDVDEVGFYMDSMGTIIGSETAALLHAKLPSLKFRFMAYDSPAVGEDVLSDKSRSDGYTLLSGVKFPGAEYSRYARQAAELYLRMNEIRDLPSLLLVNDQVHHEVFDNDDLAANTLLAEQFQMIVSADVADNLKSLASSKDKDYQKPVIVFMGAKDPARDDVVNVRKSYQEIKKWTGDAGLTLLGPYGIRDFYHGAQWRSAGEYRWLLSKRILPDLAIARAAQAVQTESPDAGSGQLIAGKDPVLEAGQP